MVSGLQREDASEVSCMGFAMNMMWGMPAMMLVGAFVWILTLVLIGLGIWWLVRGLGAARRDQALDLLRERYARGEIDREEFEARRRDLAA
ncbi:MAG: SHOCT domain-containing protein [Candidatus Rokuibacteriota bacterium]